MTIAELNGIGWPDDIDTDNIRTLQQAFSNHVCKDYGQISLDHFGSTQILAVRNRMQEEHFRPETINSILRSGRKLWRNAQLAGVIEDNPWDNVAYLPTDDDGSTRKIISDEDLSRLMEQFDHNFLGNYYRLLLLDEFANVPPNMLLAAMVSDYNPDTMTLTLRGTLIKNEAKFKSHTPVTVHLTKASTGIIENELDRRKYKKEKHVEEIWMDTPDYIFCEWNGAPIDVYIRNCCSRNIQLNTGLAWFNVQRLHGHAIASRKHTREIAA